MQKQEKEPCGLKTGASDNCSIIFIWSFAPTVEAADGSNNSKMCFSDCLSLAPFATLSISEKNERKFIPLYHMIMIIPFDYTI